MGVGIDTRAGFLCMLKHFLSEMIEIVQSSPMCICVYMYVGLRIRGLLEKYPTLFFYANTWWIII
jgi:hypothetical protein